MTVYTRIDGIEKDNKDVGNDNQCLLCHKQGIEVSYDTVLSLANDFIKSTLVYNKYFLCTNSKCEVSYYSDNKKIKIDEIKVPLWFKENKSKFLVCYCRNITLDDIVKVVKSLDDEEITIDKVVKSLNKEDIQTNCLLNMPTGESCNQLFLNAIEYARKIVSKR